MDKTYLERAKSWREQDEDIDLHSIQSTIGKFTLELNKTINNDGDQEKIEDIKKVLIYLKEELRCFAKVDGFCVGKVEANLVKDSPDASAEGNFDPSPLATYMDQDIVTLSSVEKKKALEKLISAPGISLGDAITLDRQNNRSIPF